MREIEAAIEAARIGAAVLLGHWEHLGKEDADIKSRNDWVSRADRESELAITSFLHDRFPSDAILGEEGGMSVTAAAVSSSRSATTSHSVNGKPIRLVCSSR